MSKQGNL